MVLLAPGFTGGEICRRPDLCRGQELLQEPADLLLEAGVIRAIPDLTKLAARAQARRRQLRPQTNQQGCGP